MKTLIVAFAALALSGCSGESFTFAAVGDPATADADSTIPADGGLDAIPTNAAGGSGGALEEEDGGVPSNGSGGANGVGGKLAAAGGAVGCTLVTHNNGLGQTWQDCVPLGVYTQAQGMKACAASGAGTCTAISRCGGTYWEIDGYTTDGSQIIGFWMYGGPPAGYVNAGSCGGPPCAPSADSCARKWD